MAIFRGVGGSGSSSDNSFLQEVTAQATIATNKASEASASATSASASATSAANSLATIQNTEVTSASFNTGDGVLTLTKLGGATVTADLDGRFLTSYTETNDLSSAVTWVNVPNAYITEGSVTQHQSAINANVSITESQISDLQSYLTAETSHADVLVDGDFTSNGFMKRTGAGTYAVDSNTYLTSEANNLTTAVTWANVPDANITQSSVTQHQGALSITESQISDLQTYLTAETNDLSTTVTWANVPDANITQSSVTQHQAALSITESQISDLGTYLTASDITGKANLSGATFTGNVNIGLPPSGTESLTVAGSTNLYGGVTGGLDVTGDITVKGTVDGVDIATRDAVLTSTTTTANSAMQDLVDDTTPQLGGDLDLNGNDITGTGNISITQSSTSTPALHIYNSDTSDVASPTIRLERRSTMSVADDDNIGKVEFYGFRDGVAPIAPTVEYANITGVINDGTVTTIDGQIDFNVAKDDTLTTVMSVKPTEIELPNATNLNVDGNIIVNGTVDGRDVATDGAKIDAIGRFGYGDSQAKGVSGTTTHTMLTFSAPAPASGTVVRSINGSVQIRFYLQNSQTPPRNLTYRTYLEMQSTGSTGTSLGTATYSSTPSSYNAWYYVTGNKTDVVSPIRGRIGTSSTGANYGTVLACYYDASANRTYIRVSKYPDAATAYANVEIFYSPTNFYGAGTYVAPFLSNDNYMRLEAINYYDTRLQLFNEIFPRTSSGLYLRMRHRNTTGSTGVSVLAYNNQGYIEATP